LTNSPALAKRVAAALMSISSSMEDSPPTRSTWLRSFTSERRGAEELRRAERIVQGLRWLAIGSWPLLAYASPRLASLPLLCAVWLVSLAYATFCGSVLLKSRRISAGAASALTTLGDTLFVTAMSAVTGGVESVIFETYYLSILATAIRFGMVEALAVATLNSVFATALFELDPGRTVGSRVLLSHVYYMYFVALIGGLLSQEAWRERRRALSERDRATMLLTLTRQIASAADLQEVLARILREAMVAIGCEGACIALRREGQARPERVVVAGNLSQPEDEAADRLFELAPDDARGVRVVADASAIERVPASWLSRSNMRCLAVAWIRTPTDVAVLVLAASQRSEPLTGEQAELFTGVAEEASIAIEKSRLLADLRDAEERTRSLLRRVIEAGESERRRLAGELHDRMGKRFFEFYYDLRLLSDQIGVHDAGAAEIFTRLTESARDCAREIRTLMDDLRPNVIDDFGFLEALKEFATVLNARGEFQLELEIDEAAPSAGAERDLMLFRILQEAVLNARKHASAKQLRIAFGVVGDRLRLSIRDDGSGFVQDGAFPGHYGILYMKERAEASGGELSVESGVEHGTEISVSVPFAS